MANALRWSEEQLAAHLRRNPPAPEAAPLPEAQPEVVCTYTAPTENPAMNKTEAEYAGMLEAQRLAGSVLAWQYEAVTLKLAHNTRYTPDFMVVAADGALEFHETKGGFIREDGWLKLKMAASMFPFRFFLCQKAAKKDGGGWSIKRI